MLVVVATGAALRWTVVVEGLRAALVALVVLAAGLTWAVASVGAAAVLDGFPAYDYDAGNRFAFGAALLLLALVCPLLCATSYWVARGAGLAVASSLAIAQVAPVAAAGGGGLVLLLAT
jgi:hypothetical protein